MAENKNNIMATDEELDKAYKIFTGGKETEIKGAEENEPYQEIEETNVVLNLPFEVEEGDEIDINGVVAKINDDGSVEIKLNKAFKK